MTEEGKKAKERVSMQDKLSIMKKSQTTNPEKGSEENLQRGREFVFSNEIPTKENVESAVTLDYKDKNKISETSSLLTNFNGDDENEVADFIKEITAPPRGKKQGRCKTTIEWQPEDYEKLAKACSKTNLSMSEFIRKCVKRVLDKM
jgi:hypothetical protein